STFTNGVLVQVASSADCFASSFLLFYFHLDEKFKLPTLRLFTQLLSPKFEEQFFFYGAEYFATSICKT
ncbi:MAG: hypothetical protein LUE64_06885, partial [Candidatus Gastranaerophilales bacterium]|nr:hypothetical protein [Candidatus Gastranaerophilales bacterium]